MGVYDMNSEHFPAFKEAHAKMEAAAKKLKEYHAAGGRDFNISWALTQTFMTAQEEFSAILQKMEKDRLDKPA